MRPASILRIVVLPHPLGPTIATNSDCLMSKLTSSQALHRTVFGLVELVDVLQANEWFSHNLPVCGSGRGDPSPLPVITSYFFGAYGASDRNSLVK